MADQAKGSVTPLASMFPADEAQKAAKRVEGAIAARQKELERLRLFASDNTNLINLVQRLPDELSHDILVPFGKAAFFPGRLIHTNEFLVLLGEGYYADRTAKQTVEILQRRGKTLEHQVESQKAMITDLEAEARFFNATAVEAEEGLVEIREDYVEEPPARMEAEADSLSQGTFSITEEEYARIESRLDELEKEELAAECTSNDDTFESSDDHDVRASLEEQLKDSGKILKGKEVLPRATAQPIVSTTVDKQLSLEKLKQQHSIKDDYLHGTSLEHSIEHSQTIKSPKGLVHEVISPEVENDSDNTTGQTSRVDPGHLKAFTGSVVEHSHGLQPSVSTQTSTQASVSNPSKPVSRFKMQRGNR